MTGGGFGGCAIALIRADDQPVVTAAVHAAFAEQGLPEPSVYTVAPSAGAGRDL